MPCTDVAYRVRVADLAGHVLVGVARDPVCNATGALLYGVSFIFKGANSSVCGFLLPRLQGAMPRALDIPEEQVQRVNAVWALKKLTRLVGADWLGDDAPRLAAFCAASVPLFYAGSAPQRSAARCYDLIKPSNWTPMPAALTARQQPADTDAGDAAVCAQQ